jgi:hypothetical protein
LGLAVDDVGVVGIDLAMETVAALHDEEFVVADAVSALVLGGAAEGEVVLSAAVDVVERRVVVTGDVVELRDGQVGVELPG